MHRNVYNLTTGNKNRNISRSKNTKLLRKFETPQAKLLFDSLFLKALSYQHIISYPFPQLSLWIFK